MNGYWIVRVLRGRFPLRGASLPPLWLLGKGDLDPGRGPFPLGWLIDGAAPLLLASK